MEETKQIGKNSTYTWKKPQLTNRILRKTDQQLMFQPSVLPLSNTFKLLLGCKHHGIDTEPAIKKVNLKNNTWNYNIIYFFHHPTAVTISNACNTKGK
jgi:hypothetical protein